MFVVNHLLLKQYICSTSSCTTFNTFVGTKNEAYASNIYFAA